jgi:hypothetical protein
MAKTVLQESKEPGYGDTKKLEAQQEAAPIPEEDAATAPEQIAQEAVAPPEEKPTAQEQSEHYPPYQNLLRIPHRYDFLQPGNAPKPTYQALADVGMLWDVLAADQNVDPTIRFIANRLKGQ